MRYWIPTLIVTVPTACTVPGPCHDTSASPVCLTATDGDSGTSGTGVADSSSSTALGGASASSSGTVDDSSSETVGTGGSAGTTTGESTGQATSWCLDADMDGYGDPLTCMESLDPIPGSVENGEDCDDLDSATYPGAAPNDDPGACMTDADDDDWGDINPNEGVVAGSDCDDSNVFTFPGAAETEDPAACMKDEDGDGWGDRGVPQEVKSGSDCYDSNPNLNPVDRILISLMGNGEVHQIDPSSGSMSVYTTFDNLGVNGDTLISAAVHPESGLMFASQTQGPDRIWVLDYCSNEPPIELMPHGRTLCGLAFASDGTLYGIDSSSNVSDNIVVIDTTTGAVETSTPITVNGLSINVGACGMALDCVNEQILLNHGSQSQILSIDPSTGVAEVVADIPEGNWGSVGLEYDSVSRRVLSNNGDELFEIEINGSNSYSGPVTLDSSSNDLHFGPTCG